jgi:anti-sigma B factor antagonist
MFNVELSIGVNGGHTVAAVCGELDLADAEAVSSLLIAAVAACGPSVILDLTGLEFIDCCGLRVLLRVGKFTRRNGGDIYLAGPQRRVRKVLSVTGLIDVFSVYPSVAEAVIGAKLAQPVPVAAM